MSLRNYLRLPIAFLFVGLVCPFLGCSKSTEPRGPEAGSMQAFLEEHPELNVENDQDADSEDEFVDGDGGA